MNDQERIEYFKEQIARLSNQVVDLQNERDALSAENAIFRSLLKLARDEFIEANQDGETDCVTPYDLYDAGPEQCLREVQAEAGRAGFLEGVRQMCDNEIGMLGHDAESCANHYAAKVRQGGA